MTSDLKKLIAEFVDVVAEEYGHLTELDAGLPFSDSSVSDLLTRARAALAEPEPESPTRKELTELLMWLRELYVPGASTAFNHHIDRAADLLEQAYSSHTSRSD